MTTDHERCLTNEKEIGYLRDLMGVEIRRLDQMLAEREKQVSLAFESVSAATQKAEAEALRARNAQNEWRATTTDLIARFASIEALEGVKDRQQYQSDLTSRLIGGLVVVALLVPVVAAIAATLAAKLVN